MAGHQAGVFPDQNFNEQTFQSNDDEGVVHLLDGPQWSPARESNMSVLEIYQFDREPTRDLKGGGACGLHVESGSSCCYPPAARPSPSSNCQCAPPPPLPPCCYPPPPPPCCRPVESCLPGLHQNYRDVYADCRDIHLPSHNQKSAENADLYLPPSCPLSSASNYCNRPTSSRSLSPPPSPYPPQLKCHCGAAQVRAGPPWETPESQPCFQTFFQGSPIGHPSRHESPYSTPMQVKYLINTCCQCSPKAEYADPRSKSLQTQTSGSSSPVHPRRNKASTPAYYPTQYAAEVVTVEKQVQCNSPLVEDYDDFDESWYTVKRPVTPSLYDSNASIRRCLRPESPLDLARSSKGRPLDCTPTDTRPECTCQYNNKPATIIKKSYDQLHYPTQNGSPFQSPEESSFSTVHHGDEGADQNITTFLREVKRILSSDVPSRMSPTLRNPSSTQDYYSDVRKTKLPPSESNTYVGRSQDRKSMLSSSGRFTDPQEGDVASRDYISRIKAAYEKARPYNGFSYKPSTNRTQDFNIRNDLPPSGRREQEFASSGRTTDRKQDWEQEFATSGRTTDRKQDWEQEFASSGRTTDRQQDWYTPASERRTDRRQWKFPSDQKWEFPSGPVDRKQEYSTCVRTIERGSSPIAITPILKDSVPNSARTGNDSARRPTMAPPIDTKSMSNPEATRNSRPMQGGNGQYDATERSSTRTPETSISPPREAEEGYRYRPGIQGMTEAEARQSARSNFNRRENTSSRPPDREIMRRCCCGSCKSRFSRSHFTTKCPFCANVHSCCCGMCSCPLPSCTSKSPILESSNSSDNYTSTTNSPGNACHQRNHPGFVSSRPKSLSPMRRTYLAGLDKATQRQRSNSTRSKCRNAFEPSPRELLESFHEFLKSESRRAKAVGSNPHRGCSDRRPTQQWNQRPAAISPDRNCSQRARRFSARKPSRGSQQQQAPWGTHPILLNPKPPNGQAVEYQLPYSGSHRGCCCPRCVNGKL